MHSGDTVYADRPLSASVPLPGGRTWRNLVTPEKSKVAETLDEFRGQFAYNLLDENLCLMASKVAQVNHAGLSRRPPDGGGAVGGDQAQNSSGSGT